MAWIVHIKDLMATHRVIQWAAHAGATKLMDVMEVMEVIILVSKMN